MTESTLCRPPRLEDSPRGPRPVVMTLCVILACLAWVMVAGARGDPLRSSQAVAEFGLAAVLFVVLAVAHRRIAGIRLVHADVAAQVADAARLQRERDRYLALSGNLYCVVTLDGAVEPLNAAWLPRLGFTAEEVRREPWLTFVHPWAPPSSVRKLIEDAGEGDLVTFESLTMCANGRRRWLSWNVQLFPSEQLAYAVAMDIDDKKKSAILLEERCDELARSNAELEQYAYVASHDLQEPLRMVSNYTQLLAERYRGQLDEKADRFIHYAVEGATRMQALIKDLLALARVNFRGKEFQRTDMRAALKQAMRNLEAAVAEAGATVTTGPLPTVLGYPAYLTQLLQNLVANAVKFRSERPLHIHVWARRENGHCTVGVRDNGIGVAPEHCSRIFGIFERLHSRSQYPGTGIGLALCRKIVQLHKGRIWVDSELGCGSTFYFTLPCVDDLSKPGSPEDRVPAVRTQA